MASFLEAYSSAMVGPDGGVVLTDEAGDAQRAVDSAFYGQAARGFAGLPETPTQFDNMYVGQMGYGLGAVGAAGASMLPYGAGAVGTLRAGARTYETGSPLPKTLNEGEGPWGARPPEAAADAAPVPAATEDAKLAPDGAAAPKKKPPCKTCKGDDDAQTPDPNHPLADHVPPGSEILNQSDDPNNEWLVYRAPDGTQRMLFHADQAYLEGNTTFVSPKGNGTDRAYVNLDPENRPVVGEGYHRVIGAANGDTIPTNLGGVDGAPGVINYQFGRYGSTVFSNPTGISVQKFPYYPPPKPNLGG